MNYIYTIERRKCVIGLQFIDKHSKLCEIKHAKYGSIQTTYFQVHVSVIMVIVDREFIQAYTQYYLLYLHVITWLHVHMSQTLSGACHYAITSLLLLCPFFLKDLFSKFSMKC